MQVKLMPTLATSSFLGNLLIGNNNGVGGGGSGELQSLSQNIQNSNTGGGKFSFCYNKHFPICTTNLSLLIFTISLRSWEFEPLVTTAR